jgi:hypothetical protein
MRAYTSATGSGKGLTGWLEIVDTAQQITNRPPAGCTRPPCCCTAHTYHLDQDATNQAAQLLEPLWAATATSHGMFLGLKGPE